MMLLLLVLTLKVHSSVSVMMALLAMEYHAKVSEQLVLGSDVKVLSCPVLYAMTMSIPVRLAFGFCAHKK